MHRSKNPLECAEAAREREFLNGRNVAGPPDGDPRTLATGIWVIRAGQIRGSGRNAVHPARKGHARPYGFTHMHVRVTATLLAVDPGFLTPVAPHDR